LFAVEAGALQQHRAAAPGAQRALVVGDLGAGVAGQGLTGVAVAVGVELIGLGGAAGTIGHRSSSGGVGGERPRAARGGRSRYTPAIPASRRMTHGPVRAPRRPDPAGVLDGARLTVAPVPRPGTQSTPRPAGWRIGASAASLRCRVPGVRSAL